MIENAKVGDVVVFSEEKRGYRVRARGSRYLVCTKPFNPKHTVLYTVVDLIEHFLAMLVMIQRLEGTSEEERTEVSHRNRIPLSVVAVRTA